MSWNYKRETETATKPGAYRCKIVSAEEKKSQSGNNMIVVQFAINGTGLKVRQYFVDGEYFNRAITKFFDAFPGIEEGSFAFNNWIGQRGAVKLKQDGDYLKIHYFIRPDDTEAKDLPDWVEEAEAPKGSALPSEVEAALDESNLPF